jgi:transcription elongation factor GreB
MRKGFTRKPQADDPATGGKNYITPSGLQRLKEEHRFLLTRERPAVTEVVAWAAANGDRSENADYQYGKRRLRQIDGRIRFLTKRIEAAEVVDPESPRAGQAAARAFFGATVRFANAAGTERVVSIVGTDEVDLNRNHISWVSPLGRALLKSAAGCVMRAFLWNRSVNHLGPRHWQRNTIADTNRSEKGWRRGACKFQAASEG